MKKLICYTIARTIFVSKHRQHIEVYAYTSNKWWAKILAIWYCGYIIEGYEEAGAIEDTTNSFPTWICPNCGLHKSVCNKIGCDNNLKR